MTNVKMWRISTLLLCAIMAESSALTSNSLLLEAKLFTRTKNITSRFKYPGQRELGAVVIIFGKYGTCNYRKVSMSSMISPRVGLTVETYMSIFGRAMKNYGPQFVVEFQNEYFGIVDLIGLDDYMREKTDVHPDEFDPTELAMIVLERSIKFSQSAPPFALIGTKLNGHKGITIRIDAPEPYSRGHKYLFILDVCVKAEEEDRFFIKSCNINARLTYIDGGNPVFSGDKLVGILTYAAHGIVIKVSEYKPYIQEIATSKNLGELYLNERI